MKLEKTLLALLCFIIALLLACLFVLIQIKRNGGVTEIPGEVVIYTDPQTGPHLINFDDTATMINKPLSYDKSK